ncbi:MAG: hypothetical protein ACHQ4H_03785 [Ktedonobacterales bacterium]
MTTRKPAGANRERADAAKTAAKRSSGHPRPAVAPAPARGSRSAPIGNGLAREILLREGIPTLASALAQAPITFFTEAPEMPPAAGKRAARTPEKAPKPPIGVRQKFGELREALAEGWEIVQPIFARPLWSVSDDSMTAFNFVLRRECTTRLVTVPAGRTVQRFIRDRQLAVDYRS